MSINLLDLDGEGLAAFVASLDEKPFGRDRSSAG